MVELISCSSPLVMKVKTDIAKMMEILRNIGAQRGGHFGKQGSHVGVDWSIVPKLKHFTGKLADGYLFLQSFKSIINNSPNKVNTFGALLEGEVSTWFGQGKFKEFEKLEDEFIKTWCTSMNGAEAIAHASKLKQNQDEHVWEYINCFEELH